MTSTETVNRENSADRFGHETVCAAPVDPTSAGLDLLRARADVPGDNGRPPRRLKIFGERNTGTNFLEDTLSASVDIPVVPGFLPKIISSYPHRLLRRTLPHALRASIVETLQDVGYVALRRRYGYWKHAIVVDANHAGAALPADDGYICLVKHPVAWMLSLKRRPYCTLVDPDRIKTMPLAEFAAMQWRPIRRENKPGIFANVFEMWNEKVRSYLDLARKRDTVVVTYEDLLREPQRTLDQIATHFSFVPRVSGWKMPVHSTKKDAKTTEDYVEYYVQEKWRENVDGNVWDVAVRELDRELLNLFDYKLRG